MWKLLLPLLLHAAAAITCQESFGASQLDCCAVGLVQTSNLTALFGECAAACTAAECCESPTICGDSQASGCLTCPPNSTEAYYFTACNGSECNATTCCEVCTECSCVNSRFCDEMHQIRDNDIPCTAGNCTPQTCCRPPQNCSEAYDSGTRFNCSSFSQFTRWSKNCTTCDDAQCCEPVATCDEALFVDGPLCNRANLTTGDRFHVCATQGDCTVAECCVAPSTCTEWSPLNIAAAVCEQRGMVPDLSANDACPCGNTNCCRPPATCSEADLNSSLTSACGALAKIRNTELCEGPACNTTTCCSPPSYCYQFQFFQPNPCAALGMFVNSIAPCRGGDPPCDVSTCCEVATSCYQISCPGGTVNSYDSCQPGGCNTTTCCRPSTCGDQVPGTCPSDHIWNVNKQCDAVAPCNETWCCEALTSCSQLPPNTCNPPMVRNLSQPCNTFESCSASNCCRPPVTCAEFNSAYSYCYPPNNVPLFTSTLCPGGTCSSQCCRAPTSCLEADQSICQGLTSLVKGNSCSGTCTSASCCENATSCSEVGSLYTYCDALHLVANFSGTFPVCCREPENCNEAQQISGYTLCTNYGTPNYNNCSGAGCNRTTCCDPPTSCGGLSLVDYKFCSRGGAAFNTTGTACANTPCSFAECCRPPAQCFEAPVDPDTFCQGVGVFQSSGNCTTCGQSECCQAPQTCEEAWASNPTLCPFLQYPKSNTPCSGTSCTPETCCGPLTSCGPLSQFFCIANGLIRNESRNESCGGPCTSAQCCQAPADCGEAEILMYSCVAGDIPVRNRPCSGASCNQATCCASPSTCDEWFEATDYAGCRPDVPYYSHFGVPCAGNGCNSTQCCRPIQQCSEALYVNPGLCAGYGQPLDNSIFCQGAGCTQALCCRASEYCREAALDNPGLCSAAGQVFDVDKRDLACPCDPAACCRGPSTCGEQQQANATFRCPADQVFNAGVVCSGACDLGQCCSAASTCGEIKDTICGGSYPLFNFSLQAKACPCDAASCCRAFTCLEGFQSVGLSLCHANYEPDISKIGNLCVGDCNELCCKIKETYAPTNVGDTRTPTSAPPTGEPTTREPTTGEPTSSAPTQKPSAPSSAPSTAYNPACPVNAIGVLIRDCLDSDLGTGLTCTAKCANATVAAFLAYRDATTLNATTFNSCLDAMNNGHFSSSVMAYLREKLHLEGICKVVASSASTVAVSLVLMLSIFFA